MKIKIIRSKFIEGLKKVQNIVAGKGSLQIIQNAMLEAGDGKLSLVTTDIDVSIKSTVECEVVEPGATTLPVKLLFSTISSCAEGVVELETDFQERARISAGSAAFKLSGMSVADFPALPSTDDALAYTLPQATLREMLRKTSYAVSQDETRKTLKGVLMSFKDGKLTMVATDGRRLALVEHEIEFPAAAERDIILPSKVVSELQRSLSSDGEARITIEKTQVAFNLGETQIYSKLLDEIYPNYRQVIPQSCANKIEVDRKLLLDAIDRASVMMMEESSSTRLTFDSNQLLVSSVAADIGEAKDIVPIKYSGERIEIVFNPSYVKDPLKAIDEDEITIELNNGSSPAVIRCSVPFLYVMMPLRIS
jgi:DNA polymerase-3 subunit beta